MWRNDESTIKASEKTKQKKVHFFAKTRYLGRRWKAFGLIYHLFFILFYFFGWKRIWLSGCEPVSGQCGLFPSLDLAWRQRRCKRFRYLFWRGMVKASINSSRADWGPLKRVLRHPRCASLATRHRHRPLRGSSFMSTISNGMEWTDGCSSLHNSTAARHPTTLTYQLHLISALNSTHQPRALPQYCLHERGLMITAREPMMKQ
jgi:hypothetical protein